MTAFDTAQINAHAMDAVCACGCTWGQHGPQGRCCNPDCSCRQFRPARKAQDSRFGQLCDCGHNGFHHRHSSPSAPEFGACLVTGCECKGFAEADPFAARPPNPVLARLRELRDKEESEWQDATQWLANLDREAGKTEALRVEARAKIETCSGTLDALNEAIYRLDDAAKYDRWNPQ